MPRRREYLDGAWTDVDEWESNRYGAQAVDLTGRRIETGDWLAKPTLYGSVPELEIRRVREVRGERVYLSESKVPLSFPGRCLIVGPGVSGFPWAGVV